ncbi:hypothetical protein [Bradyrhizobium sp. Leo170]|uniref:hypothetical protein n=1 Tax=Bradyrhizobium sp. Leo170 TaxID=1571199 RepID=UPI00102E8618|nr:hypothetical protein [Bradyrhizobium sp. Leo170]
MSINHLVAFATGVRFAIEAIEMIEIDDKLAVRTGIASGEHWFSIRGFRHTEGSEFRCAGPRSISTGSLPRGAGYCSTTEGRSSI